MRALTHKEFTFSKHRTSLLGAFVWAGLTEAAAVWPEDLRTQPPSIYGLH